MVVESRPLPKVPLLSRKVQCTAPPLPASPLTCVIKHDRGLGGHCFEFLPKGSETLRGRGMGVWGAWLWASTP